MGCQQVTSPLDLLLITNPSSNQEMASFYIDPASFVFFSLVKKIAIEFSCLLNDFGSNQIAVQSYESNATRCVA